MSPDEFLGSEFKEHESLDPSCLVLTVQTAGGAAAVGAR